MGFSIDISRVKNEDVEVARLKSGGGNRYDGPTPPADVYNAVVKKVYIRESKTGKPALNVLYEIKETGAKEVYNGCSFFQWLSIPVDPTDSAFTYQVQGIDNFLLSISSGTISYEDFVEIATNGKIVLKDPQGYEKNKNNEVEKIGTLRITGEQTAKVKTRTGEYQGKVRVEAHYLVDVPAKGGSKASAPAVADDSLFDDGDLEEWLNDNE
ncbi:MAG: hypothetical protein PHW63_11880 [Alphaproteobacteria bacterium]|nr:hypothetical protein [Alphaproteobacteria bacterium]